MKKTLVWLLAGLLALSLCACGEPSDADTQQEGEQDAQTSGQTEPASDETVAGEEKTLPSGLAFTFSETVPNDSTGTYRLAVTASDTAPADCAQEYYETMFTSDDEVHAIWDTKLNTMTCLKVSSGMLFADTHSYVDGEEKDASLLFSGGILDSKLINLSTGETLES